MTDEPKRNIPMPDLKGPKPPLVIDYPVEHTTVQIDNRAHDWAELREKINAVVVQYSDLGWLACGHIGSMNSDQNYILFERIMRQDIPTVGGWYMALYVGEKNPSFADMDTDGWHMVQLWVGPGGVFRALADYDDDGVESDTIADKVRQHFTRWVGPIGDPEYVRNK